MTEVRVKVLGGGREVGRSAILVEAYQKRVLLDYGVAINEGEPSFPLVYPPKNIDAIVLTHAHLDHSGGLPLLYVSCPRPLYTTELTLSITELLIRDFMKISGYYIPYEFKDFETMRSHTIFVKYNRTYEINGIKLTIFNAGHIPGSLSVLVEINDVRVLYTGDFNTCETCLLKPATLDLNDIDVIITEGTYAMFDHPRRDEVEKEFIDSIIEVLDNDGTVLVPSFSVGRSQEILCVLQKYGVSYPTYIDGLARTVADLLLDYPRYLRDFKLYKNAYKNAIRVRGWEDRKKAIKKPSIIVSPAGMLKGGPSVYYLEKINNEKNGLFFVSYQSRNTPGREILENGIYSNKGKVSKIKAKVRWFDFSSHCGRRELREVMSQLDENTKVIIVHTEENTGLNFKEYCERELNLETYLPRNGDEIVLEVNKA